MLSRIFSTVLLWSVVIGGLWYFAADGAVWLLTLISALTLHEFYGITEKLGGKPFRWMGLFFGVLMTAAPYYLTLYFTGGEEYGGLAPALLALAVVVSAVRILGERANGLRIGTLVATVLGLLYVPFMLHYLVRLLLLFSETDTGLLVCLWVVAVSKFCDVGALLTGLAVGRHKMAPNISPKKTWEGAVGGVLVSCGVGAGFAHFAADYLPEVLTPVHAALIALPLAVTTIVSDLVESAMKRHADVKDAGRLIPGIGGAFDLSDSLILTAPVAYMIFALLP